MRVSKTVQQHKMHEDKFTMFWDGFWNWKLRVT